MTCSRSATSPAATTIRAHPACVSRRGVLPRDLGPAVSRDRRLARHEPVLVSARFPRPRPRPPRLRRPASPRREPRRPRYRRPGARRRPRPRPRPPGFGDRIADAGNPTTTLSPTGSATATGERGAHRHAFSDAAVRVVASRLATRTETVAIAELIRAVGIALPNRDGDCVALDADASGDVTVDELVAPLRNRSGVAAGARPAG